MITFLGDVFPKAPVELQVELPGTLVLNLEAPLTDQRVGYPAKINLRGDKKALSTTFAGRDVVATLANNHVMDFRAEGVKDTLAALHELGIPHCGVGDEADSWLNPAWLEDDGLRVAVLAYADASCTPVFAADGHPGAAPLGHDRVTSDIATARSAGADRVVVTAHWGDEQVHLPAYRCVELARSFVDAGADAVVGHHSHCIQSYETYQGKPIMYGLGNCIFPAHKSPSYFDAEGNPTKVKDTRPSQRNRRSLALKWEPRTGAFEVLALYFDGSRLRRGLRGHRRHELVIGDAARYESRYSRAYVWGKLLHTIERFMASPKLPRSTHLSSVGRLIRTAPRP